ncbi:MAG: hypothetical protein QGG42_19000 [Phycisphaerae bacterium]|jgi:hypothetical protein|nr:hypothetical protein [Phycisphaerae bacterium]
MGKQHKLCFVDDDPQELERFKKALEGRFHIGVGTSLNTALDDLHKSTPGKPDLFVLDMYFPIDGNNTDAELDDLGKKWDEFRSAERAMREVLGRLGQSFKGGRDLAEQVIKGGIRRSPFVFFTRKGNLVDAIDAYENVGAISVMKKPDPRSMEDLDGPKRTKAYDEAMKENAENIARALEAAIHKASFLYKYKSTIIAFFVGAASSVAAWLIITVAS